MAAHATLCASAVSRHFLDFRHNSDPVRAGPPSGMTSTRPDWVAHYSNKTILSCQTLARGADCGSQRFHGPYLDLTRWAVRQLASKLPLTCIAGTRISGLQRVLLQTRIEPIWYGVAVTRRRPTLFRLSPKRTSSRRGFSCHSPYPAAHHALASSTSMATQPMPAQLPT
jgi:hypothetical protein